MKRPGEFEFIERIKNWVPTPPAEVDVGIGDDCAVVFSGALRNLLTIDMLVEGVHFDRSYFLPSELGHKALAVNLSDIAAMGGTPKQALVSLALPNWVDESFLRDFYQGMTQLAGNFGVSVVGGNITSTPGPLVIDVCVRGESEAKPVLRKGAQPGDSLAVTGSLGRAAAGLLSLKKWGRGAVSRFPECSRAQLMPMPRVQECVALRQALSVTAGIDISDGLSSELQHLSTAARCGFRISEEKLPIIDETVRAAQELGVSAMDLAMNGGEDYEWLFTFPKSHHFSEGTLGITVIGEAVPGTDLVMVGGDGRERVITPQGWEHLKG